jgi:hypothetical protein
MATKRVVAFLDILGFKSKLDSIPLDDLAATYENVAAMARALLRPLGADAVHAPRLFADVSTGGSWCMHYLFSDSIVLVANEDTDTSFLQLLIYVWRLSQTFLAAGLPLRGGLDYDEIYANMSAGVFLGHALTNAYQLEAAQDWAGIAINHSVAARYAPLFEKANDPALFLSDIVRRYPVPLKAGTVKDLYTVNWRFNFIVQKGTRSLFGHNDDPAVRRKIDNTLKYAKAVVDSGRIYSVQDKTPIEVRADEPPYPHGDDL